MLIDSPVKFAVWKSFPNFFKIFKLVPSASSAVVVVFNRKAKLFLEKGTK